MGGTVSRTDFEWAYTEEPHATRRKEILALESGRALGAHEAGLVREVGRLDFQNIKGETSGNQATDGSRYNFQVQSMCPGRPSTVSYGYGNIPVLASIDSNNIRCERYYNACAVASHSRSNAQHGIWSWETLLTNLFGMFVNLPIGVPCAITFRKYHLHHHKYQGDEEIDVDLPTEFEAKFFFNTFTKFIWVVFQSFFYSIRPLVVRPQPISTLEAMNFVLQFAFDVFIGQTLGCKALFFMIFGSLLGIGLHPVGAHHVSEHYLYRKGFETYSYYGWLNNLTFNIGYHSERHDFPNIPGSRLPKVREIASEYYNNLPYHTSWVKVLFDLITDPSIGPYARVKRKGFAERLRQNAQVLNENEEEKND